MTSSSRKTLLYDGNLAINTANARNNMDQIISQVNGNSKPIFICNAVGESGVLIGEDDWRAIQETMYLNSIPEMAESIIKGGKTPLNECIPEDEVKW